MARITFFSSVRHSLTTMMMGGGLKGYQNVAAWGAALTTAYFLWVKPEVDLKDEQEARLAVAKDNDRYRQIERTQPTSQEGRTTLGTAKESS